MHVCGLICFQQVAVGELVAMSLCTYARTALCKTAFCGLAGQREVVIHVTMSPQTEVEVVVVASVMTGVAMQTGASLTGMTGADLAIILTKKTGAVAASATGHAVTTVCLQPRHPIPLYLQICCAHDSACAVAEHILSTVYYHRTPPCLILFAL